MKLPKRKTIRLKDYDYSSPGVYFVTVCTSGHKKFFWDTTKCKMPVRNDNEVVLSKIGRIVECAVKNIPKRYSNVSVDKFVIMPNHIHMLIRIHSTEDGRPMVVPTRDGGCAPTLSCIIQQMKGFVTKQIGFPVWQSRFYDHIIRNQKDYNEKWLYIEYNPINWERDDFYVD